MEDGGWSPVVKTVVGLLIGGLQGSPIISRGLFGEFSRVLELLQDETHAGLELDVLLAVGCL